MSFCPVCGTYQFKNEAPLLGGDPHSNTGVYQNTCENGHVSYYSEETQEQTEDNPLEGDGVS
jgi:hypothetical protein